MRQKRRKRKTTRQGSAPRHFAPPQTLERAADLQLIAAWRHPDDPKAQRDFRRRYHNAWIQGGGNWGPEEPGVLRLTREEAEHLDMMRRAKSLEDAAKREVSWKAPNPRDLNADFAKWKADFPRSAELAAPAIFAPRILELAQRARALIAAGDWGAARPLILEAELERESVNRMLRRPGEWRKAEEIRKLAPLKKRLAENIQRAVDARRSRASERKAKVHERAAEMLAGGRRARADLTELLSKEFQASKRTIRRDLESLPGRAERRGPRSRP